MQQLSKKEIEKETKNKERKGENTVLKRNSAS